MCRSCCVSNSFVGLGRDTATIKKIRLEFQRSRVVEVHHLATIELFITPKKKKKIVYGR